MIRRTPLSTEQNNKNNNNKKQNDRERPIVKKRIEKERNPHNKTEILPVDNAAKMLKNKQVLCVCARAW